MNIKYMKLPLAAAVSLALSACNGSDSSDPVPTPDPTPTPVPAPVPTPETTPLNGKVIDGYISGATVFLDKNRNSVLDDGEPSALSDGEGAYSLPLTEADILALPTSPIAVLVGAGAKDIDTGEEFTEDNNLLLTTPPILDFEPGQAANFSQAITPFTTQLYNEVKDTLELVVTGELSAGALTLAVDTAKSTVLKDTAEKLGIETDKLEDLLFTDFLAPAGEAKLELAELEKIADLAVSETDNLQESQQLEDELAGDLKDNQKVTASINEYSFIEWHTGKTLLIKEISTKTTTTADNGDKLIERKATKYRLNADGTLMQVAGEPLIYEIVSDTTNEKSDGTFETVVKYEIDKNGDNKRLFKGQSYRRGTWTATSREFTEYFDESAPSVELPEVTWDGDRSYQGSDIKTAVLAEDYTDIDFIQHKTESKVNKDGKTISTLVFSQFTPKDGAYNLEQANYAETRIDTHSATGVLHEVKKDWDADGSINEYIADEVLTDGTTIQTTTKPIWQNAQKSDNWQEYADYNFTGKPLSNFWLEQTITNKKVDGLDVVISQGERYLLDSSTNTAKQDGEGNKIQFSTWLSTTTQRTTELSVEQVKWTHTHQDDSLFNSAEENFTVDADDLGQKVAYSVKYANDIWLTWDFPEWGGQNVSNLLKVVDAQLAENENDYSAVDIRALMVDGSTETPDQDWLLPTSSFIEDAQGNVRTWYIVTNTFDGELKLHETTLPNLNADWELIFIPGGAITHVPDGFNFENWNNTTQNVNMPPITEVDTEKGSFSFAPGFGWNPEYPFHMYLDKSEAEAKLAQLSTPEDGTVKAQDNQAVIYAMTDAENRADWTLHVWNNDQCDALDGENIDGFAVWGEGVKMTGEDENGVYWVLPLLSQEADDCVNFIVRDGEGQSTDLKLKFADIADRQAFVSSDFSTILDSASDTPPVALEGLKGALIDAATIAWNVGNAASYEAHYLVDGGFEINGTTGEVVSTSTQEFALTSKDMPEGVAKRYENYKAFAFELPDGVTLDTLLQGQLVVTAKNAEGRIIDATGMQLAPGLDAVYATGETGAQNETMGAVVNGSDATFNLWAPTAKNVSLYLYDADLAQVGDAVTMTRKENGTWEAIDVADALGKYYRYEVKVYHAALDSVETLQVTDPYSLSLSTNSKYSQVVDLSIEAKPAGWDEQVIPTVNNPEEQVIYETHLRDLSSAPGDGGSDALDGKYTAITETERESIKQLASLAENGLNTIHLLNLFDIATVNEDPEKRVELSDTVAKLCGLNTGAAVCDDGVNDSTIREVLESYDSESSDAQALMNDLRMFDSFNWGYDPFHYTTPEGSYATDAEGTARIEEYRTLIMELHNMGYRVVMDVVYNHTNSAGTDDKSVLDKIVPGYYQRLNASGSVENSTCCSNTATENVMMGKLMTDSLVTWAQEYKIDGFRFDLMGHQPKQLMLDSLAAVKVVDADTYFYGEGWNFGEVQNDALFVQATQANMAGTEIGTYSDRLRDAVRGGGPFDGGDALRANQGFATAGIWNEMQEDEDASVAKLRKDGDIIRLGMAGNLAKFILLDQAGNTKRGQDIDYNGQNAGYTVDPQENVSYVSKHDNQTLWDNNMYKAATDATSAQRAQMQILALSTNMLGQGIPFIHMGSELLRSKSMQRDSYDSGDWYNIVNYDKTSNNWNVGLPREDKDGSNWPLITKIIADTNAAPTAEDIAWTDARFKELLKIRTSSPLFSLTTEAEVKARVDFQNTGTDSIAGVIVMSIDDGTGVTDLDPAVDAIVAVINATNEDQVIPVTDAAGFALHSALVDGTATFADGKFTVPALTTAVFVKAQGDAQGTGLAVDDSTKDLSSIPPFGDDIPHIRGDMNNWGDADAMKFTAAGVYSMTMTLEAGTYGFKVADPTWGAINYGASGALVLGEVLALDGGDNISLTLAADSVVTFKFDAGDKDAATLTVTAEEVKSCSVLEDSTETAPLETDLYIKGELNGWSAVPENQLTYKGDNIYQVVLTDTVVKSAFKIANADWSVEYAVHAALSSDIEYTTGTGDGNDSVDLAQGDWSFMLTLDAEDNSKATLLIQECSQ
ncbi:pullulanase-type alpha-1,6-glucosidase [Psychromonas ossibalaenae]|uniref:pullulanase-type alpha-1,6-glucosidase n=1 Tax=Psychromonas ossibalaenae TaxID=444922 RepID=UPI0003AA145A|nr:pullulanase-type alpha-1,6-glucosidase [Psychromonas ossibalaenae]